MPYIKPKTEIEFIFHKDGSNETMVLHGEVGGFPSVMPTQIPNEHPSNSSNIDPPPYDSPGAMLYLVAVIVVYSLSMFFIVAALLRRKSSQKSLDGQVDHYMKGLEAAREQDKMEQVLRTRLRWPGNYIQFGYRESQDSGSDTDAQDHDAIRENCDDNSSLGSYIEIPATTVTLQPTSCNDDTEDAQQDLSSDSLPVVHIPEYMKRNRRTRTGTRMEKAGKRKLLSTRCMGGYGQSYSLESETSCPTGSQEGPSPPPQLLAVQNQDSLTSAEEGQESFADVSFSSLNLSDVSTLAGYSDERT